VTGKRARALVGGVEHDAVETGIGAAAHQIEIRVPVGEADGYEAHALARQRGERVDRRRRVAREDAELDDIDAGRGHGACCGEHRRRRQRQIADRGADRPLPRHRGEAGAERRLGKPAQGARLRLLQVDDVGTTGQRDKRLRRRADAGKKLRHDLSPSGAAA
jgi:hypothetical protein